MRLIPGNLYRSTYSEDVDCIFRVNNLIGIQVYCTVLIHNKKENINFHGTIEHSECLNHCVESSEEELAQFKGKLL